MMNVALRIIDTIISSFLSEITLRQFEKKKKKKIIIIESFIFSNKVFFLNLRYSFAKNVLLAPSNVFSSQALVSFDEHNLGKKHND